MSAAAAPAVELEEVVAGYYADQPVLRGLSITCPAGEVTALLGPNGAGKSTALRVIAGLLRPASGSVRLFGEDVTGLSAHEIARRGLAFLPQGRSAFPELTVENNLELGAWSLPRAQRKGAVAAMFERFPSLKGRRKVQASRLSGGQQRLLEISRALVADPRVLVVDEPSVGLSPILAEQSYSELAALRAEGRTVVLVDQNVRPAVALADYLYSLRSGRSERAGRRNELASDLSALVREWLGVVQVPAREGAAGTPAGGREGGAP